MVIDGMVSIIMPAFNSEKFISESIESVLKQSYKNWELLIVDDCSTDKTIDIIKKYKKLDNRITLLQNSKNSGTAISRNNALNFAHGEWIAFLDSDDLWMPFKLEKQIEFMNSNHCYFSYTNYELIDENGFKKNITITGPNRITQKMLSRSCYMGCLTVMYNSKIIGILKIPDIKKRNDYALWLKAIKNCDCYLLNETLAQYRKVHNSISSCSKIKLLQYHYFLFRRCEKMNIISSLWFTFLNALFKLIRNKKYVIYNHDF